MSNRKPNTHGRLLCSVAGAALLVCAGSAHADDAKRINIAPQSLASALHEFGVQSGYQVLFKASATTAKTSPGAVAEGDMEVALSQLLAGTGMSFRRAGDVFLIEPEGASDPQSGSAAGDGADQGTVQALIVTAQKREENIQDVPIAMSAFSQEELTRSQVAGGPDLITQVPNMTFTKTNFSSYSIQIRGIGTQAISATTDAAVAVAFNNTPFIRNRFFEQEFYDLQRVEVLRGPQGTLYGRNATAGVVNMISQKPSFGYEAKLSADIGNFNSSRLEGMINLPLVDDKVALRVAGAWTKRDGYDLNQITGNRIDGRDLWSTRTTLRFEPSDNLHANLLWEHFQENDDRLRSGKQLCHEHEVTSIAAPDSTGQWRTFLTPNHFQTLGERGLPNIFAGVQATFSQGCAPASLYSPDSFETPNGLSLPYYVPLSQIGLPAALNDPYVSRTQSHDLRVIESTVDPKYWAKSDLVELQFSLDLANDLTLTSETGYNGDRIFSSQDYNRFNTASGAFRQPTDFPFPNRDGVLLPGPNGGIFCDPQVGCADRLVAVDVSTAKSRQFSEELRLASNFDGAFNFSVGANFLRYDTEDKYYVFINTLTLALANRSGLPPYIGGVSDNRECLPYGLQPPNPNAAYDVAAGVNGGCGYIDPNPIGSVNDLGHNYFLSKNPYKLISYAVFGESYYNITDNLKLTAGLRWTVDKKEAPRIPSWLLASNTAGYPVAEVIGQEWREPTGRVTLDWKPDLSFTDASLIYASYAHGYKAGGANPPAAAVVGYGLSDVTSNLVAQSATQPKTFDPEFVNALEVGSKNTLLDGRMTFNIDGFYYDYTGYQISYIVNRSAVNLNFDAKVWGAELEADWRPLENLRLGLKGGYEKTRVADGMRAIDVMDRTAGDPNWIVVSPFPTFPSNCILPVSLFVGQPAPDGSALNGMSGSGPQLVNLGGPGGGNSGGCELAYALNLDPVTDAPYVDLTNWTGPVAQGDLSSLLVHPNYPGFNPATAPNHGEGIYKDLSGKELPNAPHFTATVTADYTLPLPSDWLMTLHTDLYYQSEAWTRIFNTPGYDKLKAFTNVNLAAIFTNDDAGWKVMAYVKNVLDRDNITGAFLNSDDSGLTTNVFLTEPRLYGVRITKEWKGGPWWTGANSGHRGPYPLTIELAGMVESQKAGYSSISPFAGAFPAALDPVAPQHRDLDLGDGREVRLVYRPASGPWAIGADVRYGRANTSTFLHSDKQAGPPVCGLPGCKYSTPSNDPNVLYVPSKSATNWSDRSATDREEHLTADFVVGKDLGLGVSGNSALHGGVRYAQFKSTSKVSMDGIPDWQLPEGWIKYAPGKYQYASTAHHYRADIAAKREFKGAGPVLSWDAERALIGDETAGRLAVAGSLAGGVLFGRQETSIVGAEEAGTFQGKYSTTPEARPPLARTPIDIRRTRSISVPVIDVSLGLSYDVGRIKVGTGYRWERYFYVLDAGYAEHKSYDRTFDGPYFKIAVGFGG
jgi:outer membrane receptor protein involved in Fe transport